ncbi:MAG: hypothetical protein M3165_06685 [Actinomycetota bacterium]|nr:hypothetical protein [Actinomycetota bacterium]
MPSPRQSSRCRHGLVAVLAAAALALPSGCASGFDSPVLQDYNPAVGVNVRDGDVWAMNLLVVLSESGQGTLVGALLNKGRRTDRLVDATVQSEQDEEPVSSSMLRSSVPLTPGRLVEMSEPPTVAVEGTVTPGRFVTVTLQFQRAEPVEVEVPVVAPEGPYEHVQLPGTASPSPGPSPTATGERTPAAAGGHG